MSGAVAAQLVALGGDRRRDVVEGVQLAVLVRERRPDGGTVVLERHHVGVAGAPQGVGALAQHGADGDELGRAQVGDVLDVASRVDHDLTPPTGRGEPLVA